MPTRFLIAVALVLAAFAGGVAHLASPGGAPYAGRLRELTGKETALAIRLREQLEYFTLNLGARSLNRAGTLQAAAEEIEARLRGLGYDPKVETFRAAGRQARNLFVDLPSPSGNRDVVLLGTHYDTYRGSPGANANGSGLVALLELARLLKDRGLPFTLRLAFFANGERPYLGTEDSGAVHHARRAARDGVPIRFALLLGSLGYFATEPGSQDFPFPTSLCYPDVADFLTVLGGPGGRGTVEAFSGIWNRHCPFPLHGNSLPAWFPGVPDGDHGAFEAQGIPALLLSDTGAYRYGDHGGLYDLHTRLDYGRMARIVQGLERIVPDLEQLGG